MPGGGQFDLPSKSHVWCPNMTNDTSLESSYALLLESAKNFKFGKIEIFVTKSSYILKMFAKKECPKLIKYTFWKSHWPCHVMTYSLKYIFGRSPAPLPHPIFSTKNRTGDGNVIWLRTPWTERNRMIVLRLKRNGTEQDETELER